MSESGRPISAVPTSAREGQLRTSFSVILETLCGSCTGSLAAALVDEGGESVDHASLPVVTSFRVAPAMKAFSIKIAAAEWQIVMRRAWETSKLGGVRQLWVEAEACSYLIQRLAEGYVLLFVCRPGALASVSVRALRECEVALALEAGWQPLDPDELRWTRTRVKLDRNGKPGAVWRSLQWQGPLQMRGNLNVGSFERGYEVAAPDGVIIQLVREPTGLWYAGSYLPSAAERHPSSD